MTKLLTERHRICIETETSPTSFVSAGSTAYSLVKKIGVLIDTLWSKIINYGFATETYVDSAKQEIKETVQQAAIELGGVVESAETAIENKVEDESAAIQQSISGVSAELKSILNQIAAKINMGFTQVVSLINNIGSKLLPDISSAITSAKQEILDAIPAEATEAEVEAMFSTEALPYVDGNGYLNNFTYNDDGTISSQYANVNNNLIEE